MCTGQQQWLKNALKCKKDKKHLTRARDCINFAANLAGTAFHVASVTIMTKKRSTRISTFGSQLTSIISVALVLMILGVLALTTTRRQSRRRHAAR